MREIEETTLPGVGVRHEFVTRDGDRIGVLSHRTGHRELLIYDDADPDSCSEIIPLEDEDAAALAELLGGTQVAPSLTALAQEVEGLVIDWLRIREQSACARGTLGASRLRAETGVSVVAAIRGEETVPAPGSDYVLEPGDTLVVVGTAEGIRRAADLLRGA